MSTNDKSEENWPEIPGYWEVTKTAFGLIKHEWIRNANGNGIISEIEHFCSRTTTAEICIVLLGAVIFTIGRFLTSKYIFIPWARRVQIPKRDESKMPESAYKSLFYTSIWFLMLYLIFAHHENIFRDPVSCFKGWTPTMVAPFGIRLVYALQASFYIHSVFATLYMDTWRKDSYMMLLHHFLTLSLVGFSYFIRYHNIGLLVFFLHDITDVFLENSKLLIYFKIRRGKKYPIHDQLANIGFAGFSVSWFVFRLYWFPLKALWSAANASQGIADDVHMPLILPLNVMLWLLLIMNMWWFTFILLMLYKVITGQTTEIGDIREEGMPSEKKFNEMHHVGNGKQNGVHSKSNGMIVHNNGTLTHRPTAGGAAKEVTTTSPTAGGAAKEVTTTSE